MVPEESSAARDLRIADVDRDRVVAVLRLHCTEGRITLDEFSDRVGEVYNARTIRELDEVVLDLPVPRSDATTPAPALRPRRSVKWLVAVFGDSSRRGRFTLDDESAAIAAFGDCTLDLSEALIDGPNPLVTAVAVFGDVTVIVPDGIEVDLEGVAVFGDKRVTTGDAPPLPGSPVVLVRAFALFGDVRVRPAGERTERRFGRAARVGRR
ncbi:MAG TPA: DUF1707 domain-containing protein [Acidimicrobiales bacterium]|nr:DUF1707 domain-containing protein [Acidimicrobiales bacterium]